MHIVTIADDSEYIESTGGGRRQVADDGRRAATGEPSVERAASPVLLEKHDAGNSSERHAASPRRKLLFADGSVADIAATPPDAAAASQVNMAAAQQSRESRMATMHQAVTAPTVVAGAEVAQSPAVMAGPQRIVPGDAVVQALQSTMMKQSRSTLVFLDNQSGERAGHSTI